jgi:uncharacterized protein YbaA (DUF1428 family)
VKLPYRPQWSPSLAPFPNLVHRDAVLKRAMADPRMKMDMSKMPFDGKRMIYGGFKTFLAL